jgi:arginase
VAALKKMYKKAKVIWIDAHLDCNSPSSSPSGNMHGMPLGYLCGHVEGY